MSTKLAMIADQPGCHCSRCVRNWEQIGDLINELAETGEARSTTTIRSSIEAATCAIADHLALATIPGKEQELLAEISTLLTKRFHHSVRVNAALRASKSSVQ